MELKKLSDCFKLNKLSLNIDKVTFWFLGKEKKNNIKPVWTCLNWLDNKCTEQDSKTRSCMHENPYWQ